MGETVLMHLRIGDIHCDFDVDDIRTLSKGFAAKHGADSRQINSLGDDMKRRLQKTKPLNIV